MRGREGERERESERKRATGKVWEKESQREGKSARLRERERKRERVTKRTREREREQNEYRSVVSTQNTPSAMDSYWVASISRLFEIIGLFCKRAL